MSPVVLQARGLVKRFDGIIATDHVDLALTLGARHALIGPNGAGKTTLINLLTGVLAPTEGRIELPLQVALKAPRPTYRLGETACGAFLAEDREPGFEGVLSSPITLLAATRLFMSLSSGCVAEELDRQQRTHNLM